MTERVNTESPINDSFRNKSVLITGATGLVGKFIVYKILNSVKSVKNVYILIRSKKGKSFTQRFDDMMSKSHGLFKNVDSRSLQKLIPIEGDITADGLGLKKIDRNTIIDNVSVVFHSAADVTFDANLKQQLKTNVMGTKAIINLCRELKKLDVFIYVSTTYSNPLEMVTEEKVYDSTAYALDILNSADIFEKSGEYDLEFNSKLLIGKFPNTYTFTKNLAENLVNQEFKKGGLPTAIVRPGIVSTSLREPFCGWFDSITSISGGFLLVCSGLARHSLANPNITADAIPVDIVANTCIAAATNSINKYSTEIRVYNCNASCLGAPNVLQSYDFLYEVVNEYPLLKAIRPMAKVIQKNNWIPIFLIQFFSETCFAYFLDFLLFLIGRKRVIVRHVKTYQRLTKACQCFLSHQWYYTNNNFLQLSQELIGNDKTTFDCDVRAIDWIEYQIKSYFMTRRLLLKETEEDVYRAQKFQRYLKIGYTVINHLLVYLMLELLLAFSPIGSFFRNLLNSIGFNSNECDIKKYGLYLILSSALFDLVLRFSRKKSKNREIIKKYVENLKTFS